MATKDIDLKHFLLEHDESKQFIFIVIQENLVVILVLTRPTFNLSLSDLFICLTTCPRPGSPWWYKSSDSTSKLISNSIQACFRVLICLTFTSLWLIQVIYELCIIFSQSGSFPHPTFKYISVKRHMSHWSSFTKMGFAQQIIKHEETLKLLWCFDFLNETQSNTSPELL